jgi:hypothetical protein
MNNQDLLLQMAKDFDADFENGILYWVKPRKGKKEAGTFKPAGKRFHVIYKKKEYLRYRILFALYYGYWPFGEIDHIDGNSSNDKISNLRDVTRSENARNCKLRVDNKYGCSGISFHQGKWRVRIGKNHKSSFEKLDDAIAYRKKLQSESGYTERHGQ